MSRIALVLLAGAVFFGSGGGVGAVSCRLDDNEVLLRRDKRCGAEIIKATCNGEPIDIVEDGPACCALPQNRKISWRCGGQSEPDVRCPPGSTSMLITPSRRGALFRCLRTTVSKETPQQSDTEESGGASDDTTPAPQVTP